MAKVLVIRKPDKTIHVVPMANKASLLAFNNRQPAGNKWIIEEADADAAAKLPFVDENFVTPAEAQSKVKGLETELSEKDKRIAELEEMLKANESQNKSAAKTSEKAEADQKSDAKKAESKKTADAKGESDKQESEKGADKS